VLRGNLEMSVKLFLLKSGESIISDGKEILSGDSACGYLFENPFKVTINSSVFVSEGEDAEVSVSLSPWIILSADETIPIPHDWVVTMVEPIDSIKKMYEDQVNGKNSQNSSTNEQSDFN